MRAAKEIVRDTIFYSTSRVYTSILRAIPAVRRKAPVMTTITSFYILYKIDSFVSSLVLLPLRLSLYN